MHPSVVQNEPGNCPICGMPLSKRPKGEKQSLPEGVTARIQLAPFRIAQAGIRTVEAAYSPMSESVTTVGYVTFDERRLARISSKIKGMARVEKLFVNFTGTFVEVGDPLAELYSPELYQATRELYSLRVPRSSGRTLRLPSASHSRAIRATWSPWPATSLPSGESLMSRWMKSWRKAKPNTVRPSSRPSVASWFGKTSLKVST